MRSHHRRLLGVLILLPLVFALAPAEAEHSWGGYHWSRTSNPLSLTIADHLTTTEWGASLELAVDDWDQSTMLALNRSGFTSASKKCPATTGRVDVCNAWYGYNGWLGIAQIWISGGHISAGIVKLNDSYHNSAPYSSSAWRNFVMCQEIGHTFGLDHQDEDFDNENLGSCMDYTSDPSTNQAPNQHDLDQLQLIYGHHTDGAPSGGGKPGKGNGFGQGRAESAGGNSQDEWGRAVDTDEHGRPDLFVQDLPNGDQVFTHVIWAS